MARGVGRAWVLYGVVLFGVVLEVGMGLYVHLQLGQRPARWSASGLIWTVSLSVLAVLEAVVGLLVHRWLLSPASLLRRLRESLKREGLRPGGGPRSRPRGGEGEGERVPLELLTVVAVRAVFLADVVAWLLLQFITIYGLLLVVITGQLWLLLTFATVSLALLTRVTPSYARMGQLIQDLRDQEALSVEFVD
jgi:hypothetical protein